MFEFANLVRPLQQPDAVQQLHAIDPPQLKPCDAPGGVHQLIFASGGFDMEASPLAALSPNEEITLRRIAFGIGGGSTLRREDVGRLTKLYLVVARGNALILTAQGESRIAQQHGAKRDPLGRKEADALARVLGIKL